MVRFGAFRFDAAARQLRRDGVAVHLPPKVFDLLGILVEAAPRVVGKRQLHARLWPGGVVADATLVALIKQLRKALGDRDHEPPLIRTVNRVGYALDTQHVEAPPAPDMERWLLLAHRRHPLAAGANVVGRDLDAQVHIDAAAVSRRHARIHVSAEVCLIEDLGSKNGTFVDGQRVGPASLALRDGMQLLFGTAPATFREAGLAMPTLTHHGLVQAPRAPARRRGS